MHIFMFVIAALVVGCLMVMVVVLSPHTGCMVSVCKAGVVWWWVQCCRVV